MKKYLLFTTDNIADDYYVFQGDYDSLGEAFRAVGKQTDDEGKLCVYKIVTWKPHAQVTSELLIYGSKIQKCVAQGFINPENLATKRHKITQKNIKEEKEKADADGSWLMVKE